MGKSTVSMVIFNSYVKLPEGSEAVPLTFLTPKNMSGGLRGDHLSLVVIRPIILPCRACHATCLPQRNCAMAGWILRSWLRRMEMEDAPIWQFLNMKINHGIWPFKLFNRPTLKWIGEACDMRQDLYVITLISWPKRVFGNGGVWGGAFHGLLDDSQRWTSPVAAAKRVAHNSMIIRCRCWNILEWPYHAWIYQHYHFQ